MSEREDIINGSTVNKETKYGLVYTCQCGWIDVGHANPKSRFAHQGAANLWTEVKEGKGQPSKNGLWYKVTFEMVMGRRKKVPFTDREIDLTTGVTRHYAVKVGLSTAEKESVALAIFMQVSRQFEELQGSGGWGWVTDSSFSAEDLVSNLIGFYQAVRGGATELIRQCQPVSKAAAEAVWDTYGAVGAESNKVREFRPRLFPCSECSGSPPAPRMGPLPLALTVIKPAPFGLNYRTWSEDDPYQRDPMPVAPGTPARELATVTVGERCRKLAGKHYDMLSRIAQDFYGDALLWPVLYDHAGNRKTIGDNPNSVKNGQKIVVPDITNLTGTEREAIRARGRNWQQYNK
jgi:hypothetical protein